CKIRTRKCIDLKKPSTKLAFFIRGRLSHILTIQRIVHVGVMFWIRKCAHTKMVQLMLYYMINVKLMNTEILDYLNKDIKNYNSSSMLFLISLVCMTSNIM